MWNGSKQESVLQKSVLHKASLVNGHREQFVLPNKQLCHSAFQKEYNPVYQLPSECWMLLMCIWRSFLGIKNLYCHLESQAYLERDSKENQSYTHYLIFFLNLVYILLFIELNWNLIIAYFFLNFRLCLA